MFMVESTDFPKDDFSSYATVHHQYHSIEQEMNMNTHDTALATVVEDAIKPLVRILPHLNN